MLGAITKIKRVRPDPFGAFLTDIPDLLLHAHATGPPGTFIKECVMLLGAGLVLDGYGVLVDHFGGLVSSDGDGDRGWMSARPSSLAA